MTTVTLIQFTPQVESGSSDDDSDTTTTADCDEIGRVSKAYASAHYRQRIHDVQLMSGEKRCLVADYNGAISSSRTIAGIKWRCDGTPVARMSNARIQSDSRSAAVDVQGGYIGTAFLRCEATLDNGEVYVQPFHVGVMSDPVFMEAGGIGASELTAAAS